MINKTLTIALLLMTLKSYGQSGTIKPINVPNYPNNEFILIEGDTIVYGKGGVTKPLPIKKDTTFKPFTGKSTNLYIRDGYNITVIDSNYLPMSIGIIEQVMPSRTNCLVLDTKNFEYVGKDFWTNRVRIDSGGLAYLDTIPCIMLVNDTAILYSKAYWIHGYCHYVKTPFRHRNFIGYLDTNKRPLNKNLVVWTSKEN